MLYPVELSGLSSYFSINFSIVYLKEKYPKFKKHFENKTLRIAINQEYTNTNKKINENDEIALFPPVSGG